MAKFLSTYVDFNQSNDQKKLQNYIKVMSFLGFLPVSWNESSDTKSSLTFRFSKFKVFLSCTLEFIIISVVWLVMVGFFSADEGRFIFKEFFTIEFYKHLFHNVVTDSVAQLILWFTPIGIWITFLISGCSMTKHLNIVMRNSWFDFTFRTPFIAALLYSIGWCLTILRIPWKSHPGLYAVMVIFLTLPGCQFALCFALDEILILSLIKGWSKQNPEVVSKPDCPIGVEDVVSQSDLDRVVRWIEHYKSIEKMFRTFLFYEFAVILPFFTLYIYLFFTKIVCEGLFFESVHLVPCIFSLLIRQMNVASTCHMAFDKIDDFYTRLVHVLPLVPLEDKESRRHVKSMMRITRTAKPFNGSGFFKVNRSTVTSIIGAVTTYIVVLIQFKLSEKNT